MSVSFNCYELRSNGERSVIFSPDHEKAYITEIALGTMERRDNFPRLLASADADSWLEAKQRLDIELTDLQKRMLAGTATPYEITGKTYGYTADLWERDPRGRKPKDFVRDPASVASQLWKSAGMA